MIYLKRGFKKKKIMIYFKRGLKKNIMIYFKRGFKKKIMIYFKSGFFLKKIIRNILSRILKNVNFLNIFQ